MKNFDEPADHGSRVRTSSQIYHPTARLLHQYLISMDYFDLRVDWEKRGQVPLFYSLKCLFWQDICVELGTEHSCWNIEVTAYFVLSRNICNLTEHIYIVLGPFFCEKFDNTSHHYNYDTGRATQSSFCCTRFIVKEFGITCSLLRSFREKPSIE